MIDEKGRKSNLNSIDFCSAEQPISMLYAVVTDGMHCMKFCFAVGNEAEISE